jgi:hypothetical protein
MRRLTAGFLVCVLLGISLYPLMSVAQESPRSDPTGAAPEAAATPPAVAPTSKPATQPVDRFVILNGREGYWRLGQDRSGAWWFVGPRGNAEFLNTVTTVQPYLLGRDRFGADYVSRDYNAQGDHNQELDRWAKATVQRVADAGFKGMGAWSHPVLHKYDVPMTRDLNVWTWLRTQSLGAMRFFAPEWSSMAEASIERQVEPLRDNRNLVGYYIDNELDWTDAAAGPGVYFDGLPAADPNRAQVTDVIRHTWPTAEQFNAAWGTKLADLAEIDAWPQLPRQPGPAYHKLASAWLSHLAESYFRTTTSLIRKYDPNHLILGCRYRGAAEPEVVAASKGYTDAQSLNYYVSDARLDAHMFGMIHETSGGQPLIITEYSFHALDGRSGNRNTVGFPGQVLDQQARGEGYKQFTTRLARVPYIVGADWFQWMDEPPSGRRDDGEDVNFGVVDVDDRPYQPLVDAIRATTKLLNPLHERSAADKAEDLYRDSFANKPVAKVPYLMLPVRLNGELSDWPASAKLAGVRTTASVGAERNKLPTPNIYLGWREEGLYLAMEVFDNDVATASPNGWWWSRDSVEFFLSTRPVSSDQNGYDDHCYHFFFIPEEFPVSGAGGVVGQWHTPGDGLTHHLIPHPDARCAVRILPDRYVAEIFLPAKALKGFDPAHQPTLAFNAHVRNFQHAAEYYWSAPKQVLTQCYPNSWGAATLQSRSDLVPVAAPIAGTTDAAAPATGN